MENRDPFAAIVIKPLVAEFRPWVEEINELGLWGVGSPDGTELMIFNDDHHERGYLLIKAHGEITTAWCAGEVGFLTRDEARQHMREHLAA